MSLSPASHQISQASPPDANLPGQAEAAESDPAGGQVTQHESERSSTTSRHDDVEVPPSAASSGDAGELGPLETVSIQGGEPPTTSTETNTTQTTGKKPVVEESVGRQPRRHSPLRQSAPAWFSACVATGIYITTVCYAFGSTDLRYLSFTALNPGNTLLVLRTLSELTNASLVFLIGLSTERALWMLIAQDGGTRLSSFLALCPGTGPWGWIKLLYLNAGGARRLSWLKLVIVIIPPAMGIVLLSNVDVRMYFDHHASFPISAGIGDFNASWAAIYASVAATLMASDYSALLQTSAVSWSVPVIDSGRSDCDVSNFFSNETCGWAYFLHGGSQLITPWPTLNTALPTAPIYKIHSVRGLQLDFTNLASPDASFQGERDCIVLGRESNAVGICLAQTAAVAAAAANANANAVTAKFVVCPADSSCRPVSSPGWTMTMRAYVRHATVHLSRANLSAIAVSEFSTTPTPQPISAAELLLLYNTTLGVRSTLASSSSPAEQFINMLSTDLLFAGVSSPTAAQAVLKLYNLLAMPLYYFQPTYVSPYSAVPSPDRVLDRLPPDQPDLYVTASLSTMYYGLAVAAWSVWLYTVVMGTLLLCCVAVLTVGSLPRGGAAAATAAGRAIPNTTAWSFVDFVAECDVGVWRRKTTTPAVHEEEEEGEELEELALAGVANGARGAVAGTITATGTDRGTDQGMHFATQRFKAAKSRRSRADVLEQSTVKIYTHHIVN
ncbi:hypothetical protein G647_04577 [Cladophialophora carrionii CBS 160.54]|uniref:Transmembrane protein n=1 Tax=Cladophialophora carrionii CBS 160.54 TaxID=1279043 RepID=V9DE71_9EURO|nr:uncharacterized protein G647_04577 [Cladophialophora carrionii CBS 160.54]ETI25204.1 hypothetical protein G647_04577 [Cladophialophora carrionii CBS 160.54]